MDQLFLKIDGLAGADTVRQLHTDENSKKNSAI